MHKEYKSNDTQQEWLGNESYIQETFKSDYMLPYDGLKGGI